MTNEANYEVEGEVTQALPNTLFRVKLGDGREVLCYLAGKMRINYIRILPGDKVRVQMTPYDQNRGRIVFRFK